MSTQHKPGELPEVIYLQWYGDEDPECLTETEKASIDPENGSVSWCWEQIFPSDIQYVRKDKYDELLAALEYHMEMTRPIQRSIDAIAKARRQA